MATAPITTAARPNMLPDTLDAAPVKPAAGEVVLEEPAPVVAVALAVLEVVSDVLDDVELLVELAFAPRTRTPPMGPPVGAVDAEAFAARDVNFARVFPVKGALMAPTIPAWQWPLGAAGRTGAGCEQ